MIGLKPMVMIGYTARKPKDFTDVLITSVLNKTLQTQSNSNLNGTIEISSINY